MIVIFSFPSIWYDNQNMAFGRSSLPEVFCKKLFLKSSQSSQENTCVGVSFLINLPANLLKRRLQSRYFLVNFAKFLRIPFLKRPFTVTASILRINSYKKNVSHVEVDIAVSFRSHFMIPKIWYMKWKQNSVR